MGLVWIKQFHQKFSTTRKHFRNKSTLAPSQNLFIQLAHFGEPVPGVRALDSVGGFPQLIGRQVGGGELQLPLGKQLTKAVSLKS